MLTKRHAIFPLAPVLLLAVNGCTMGDPYPAAVGLALMDGSIVAEVPECTDERVTGIELEQDPDAATTEDPYLWKAYELADPASRGPFIIGDNKPWKRIARDLNNWPETTVVTVITTHRNAVSTVNKSAIKELQKDQIMIDGEIGSMESLAKNWDC